MKKELMLNEVDEIRNIIDNQKIVFLVGAGISFESPSFLTTLPQEECLKVLNEIEPEKIEFLKKRIRPEIFFQILYNNIGNRALTTLQIINPEYLNSEEDIVNPNFIHFFLATMLNKGHFVLTTNFENLIEIAFQQLYKDKKLRVIIFSDEFEEIYKEINKIEEGKLIKIHGSFITPDGLNSSQSITALLEQVQREIPEFKIKLFKWLVQSYNFIVMGYSGRDDYDLYNMFLETQSDRKIWWIRHSKDQLLDNWKVFEKEYLIKEKKKLEIIPAPLIEEKSKLNSDSIVLEYQNGKVLEVNTLEFLKRLYPNFKFPVKSGNEKKVKQKMDKLLNKWIKTIDIAERYYIISDLFENAQSYEDSLIFHDLATLSKIKIIIMKNDLMKAKIYYQKRGKVNYIKAKKFLEILNKQFENLYSFENQAETANYLALVNNRLLDYTEANKYAEIGIDLYLELRNIGEKPILYELTQALRGLALIQMLPIPDISSITNIEQKNIGLKILNQAEKACVLSIKIFRFLGNKNSKRGEGQSNNILGLLSMRKGNYQKAADYFKLYLKQSGPSRSLNESFQANRNLGISEYNLAIKNHRIKNEYLNNSIDHFRHALLCLEEKPDNPSMLKINGDNFITRFNRSRSLIERGNVKDFYFSIEELKILIESISKVFHSGHWHWKTNILTQLGNAYSKLHMISNVRKIIDELISIYSNLSGDIIEKQRFGVQNANENLQSVLSLVKDNPELKDLHTKVLKQKNIIDKLEPLIKKTDFIDFSRKISKIQKLIENL